MINKFKNYFFSLFFIICIFLTINHYVSDNNKVSTYKSRSNYVIATNNNLPLLAKDTDNIIIYSDDLEQFKKKRKKRFWEKLISNKDE